MQDAQLIQEDEADVETILNQPSPPTPPPIIHVGEPFGTTHQTRVAMDPSTGIL